MGRKQKIPPNISLEGFYFVGVRGFEPPTSTPPAWRANRATLHPEIKSSEMKSQNWRTNILVYSFSYNKIQKLFIMNVLTGKIKKGNSIFPFKYVTFINF